MAGFMLASKGHIRPFLLLATLLGISLVIASACVINNYIDRDIDARMARTKNRALVTGEVSARAAIVYAIILGLAGFIVLLLYTNLLTVMIGVIGFLDYIVLYGIWKRRGPLGTIIGSVSGAMPPLAGYCAVTGRLDIAALLLFLILVCWQMPHFYSIAIYRVNDYAEAGIPVMPIKRGNRTTKIHMLLYIVAFLAASSGLTVFGYTGYVYLAVVVILGLAWLALGLKGLRTAREDQTWARTMFIVSLAVITFLSITMSIDAIIH